MFETAKITNFQKKMLYFGYDSRANASYFLHDSSPWVARSDDFTENFMRLP